jgi:hypothetical protein
MRGVAAFSTADAISRWNELLAAGPDLDGAVAAWSAHFTERDLELDGRPLCSVLRPHFVAEERLAQQARVAALLLGAVRKVRGALAADRRLYQLHLGNLHDWIGHLLRLEPRVAGEGALVRLDASLARTRLHFIETNADTPQGAGHNDAILDFFEGMDVYGRLGEEYALRPLRIQQHQLDALLDTWREWGGKGKPTIGIVTRTGDPVRLTGVELDRDFYASRGVDAVVADPADLSFAGGRLRAGDTEVDLVHRVMLSGEFLAGGDVQPILDAVRAEAVCLVNPFSSELLGHKAIFALLTDPEQDFGFSAAEREAIRDHVPWARPVADGPTTDPAGKRVDLVEHLREQRQHLVLKPAHDFGGHGVALGWREDDSAWERAIEVALEADFIAQRRVELQREEYPSMEPGAPARRLYEDTDPFMFRGEFGGLLTRLGASEITNVHADGSVCASVALAPR